MYVKALADFDLTILLPMIVGLGVGAVVISLTMNMLFKRFYTLTFSVIFGVFISMIPNMLNETCVLGWNMVSLVSVVVMVIAATRAKVIFVKIFIFILFSYVWQGFTLFVCHERASPPSNVN